MDLEYRPAREADLPTLIKMLADDPLGATREDQSLPINPDYLSAFVEIEADNNNELVVIELQGKLVGMLQLTFIPYLTHTGSRRCLIEGVRVHKDHRGSGLGRQFFEWAIQCATEKGCNLVQLTSNKQRPEVIRFYESLGFRATHEGFKLETDAIKR